jgi:UDP-N-acetyl-D-glucosamine dehydrogenase
MRRVGRDDAAGVSNRAGDAPPVVAELPETAAALHERLTARTAAVGVIGLGYVGLPLVQAVAAAGFSVLGLDIDRDKVEALNAGRSYLRRVADRTIAGLRAGGRFEASADFTRVRELDVVVICVPTPLTRHREPDLRFVVQTAEAIARQLRRGQLVVLESTTYAGTTREVVRPILQTSGLEVGRDVFLAYSPEREDPGNREFTTSAISKVVGGDGAAATRLATTFYDQFVIRTVVVSSPDVAEAVKLTENVFRAVNIALVNELKVVFDAMGIDVWEVIEAAATKPFGYMPFHPGPGLGGHCIPIDPFYLAWKARQHGVTSHFIELAGEINTAMPRYVVDRLARALDQRFAKGLNGTRVLILGLAYKKNVDDMRESPALTIMELLEARGARLAYHDPLLPVIPPSRDHGGLAGRRSIALTAEAIASFAAVLIVTDHDDVDYAALVAAAPLVVDTRNATRHVAEHRERIVTA